MSDQLQKICNQLITTQDLTIEFSTLQALEKADFTIEIFDNPAIIKIFSLHKLTLSNIIPLMHDFNFSVNNEVSFSILNDQKMIYVTKLYLDIDNSTLLIKHQENIKEILTYALHSKMKERCSLFALSYTQDFCMHTIQLLRTFSHYENQLVLEFNIPKIFDTLVLYHALTNEFFNYFSAKFDPSIKGRQKKMQEAQEQIYNMLKDVKTSDDDRILKLFFKILQNCIRTNYYLYKESISIKIDLSSLKQYLKGIQPEIEAYVYHQEFRGLHMRMSKIARGGLRYSSRKDDYRLEIKSLMATQEGKNAVIIPSGAKGGFIIDTPKSKLKSEQFTQYYSQFIDALLDLVDNLNAQNVIKQKDIISYDGDDTYFVVAADRGTSNMSDVANSIAKQRSFWIDDAFASGGSHGFHHKKLGITAKGALKSSERFFIEKGVDFYKESITIVGIGSMSGDVFGNGMIESEKFKLIGAISHDEIFIDPKPDIKKAYQERLKLFSAKKQKWSDYDTSKISKGGGVYKRSDKDISLNTTLQELFKTRKKVMDGEEIASALLRLSVDMIYNGGIGTYIKSSEESNLEVGDKENEYVRINANEVNAFCICEGGNLGLTQKARYEYARGGGKIHLDSIDNAAGVNTSDHEVNLKIILAQLVQKNFITSDKKNETLKTLTPHVVNNVLWTNYHQALCIALERRRSLHKQEAFIKVLNLFENNLEVFKRRYFNLPKDIDFDEIVNKKGYIIRPALAVILLYAKIFLKKILNESNMYAHDSFFQRYLFKYFPKEFLTLYEDAVLAHPLKNEIISMIIANKIINQYGATFLSDYESLGREKFLLKIKAYLITNQLYNANDVRYEIYRSDYKIPVEKQYKMLLEIEDKIEYNINWMLRSLQPEEFSFETILDYKSAISAITQEIELPQKELVPNNTIINTFFSKINYIKFATAVIKIKKQTGAPFERCALLFFQIVQEFEIPILIEHIENITLQKANEAILQVQLQMLLESLLITLTNDLLAYQRSTESYAETLNNYLEEKQFDLQRYKDMLTYLKHSEQTTISDLSIIVNHFLLIKG